MPPRSGRTRAGIRLLAAAPLALAMLTPPGARARPVEAPPFSEAQVHRILVGGMQRTYRLQVPAGLPADRPVPLLLVFHGGGGTPGQIERESGFSELAAREGFIVAYPTGHRRSWNDGRGTEAVAAQRDRIDDVAFVSALIDEVAARHRIDARRVFATGISNGAMFSHHLALRLSDRIAAIAPVAGGLPEPLAAAFEPRHPVSVLIVNGTHDPLVPYDGGDVKVFASTRGRVVGAEAAAAKWAAHDRCDPTPAVEEIAGPNAAACSATRFTWRQCLPGTGVGIYRLNQGGHTWPGGRQYLPERMVGRVCREVDGAALIWDFFSRHPKP